MKHQSDADQSGRLDPDIDLALMSHEISDKLKAIEEEYGFKFVLCKEKSGVATLQAQWEDRHSTAITIIQAKRTGCFVFVGIDETFNADEALPDWLDRKAWRRWVDYRSEIKKPLTHRMRKQQMKFLHDQHKIGMDHAACIDHSISQGYVGLFPARRSLAISRGACAVDEFAGG